MTYKPYDHPSKYSVTSIIRLETCHTDLQRLFRALAADGWDITIICGHRGEREQNEAFANNFSKAMWPNSEHNFLPSRAVDVGPYVAGSGIDWDDPLPWHMLSGAVQAKAKELDIKVKWGGYFKSSDLPHWELEEDVKVSENVEAPYGYCPHCDGKGITRERRINGDDRCSFGHVYPSTTAIHHD